MNDKQAKPSQVFASGLYFGLGFWIAFILLAIPATCLVAVAISIITA